MTPKSMILAVFEGGVHHRLSTTTVLECPEFAEGDVEVGRLLFEAFGSHQRELAFEDRTSSFVDELLPARGRLCFGGLGVELLPRRRSGPFHGSDALFSG